MWSQYLSLIHISINNQKLFDKYHALALDTKSTQKVLYLTFDCGYENGYTAKILSLIHIFTSQVADFLFEELSPQGVAVIVEAEHLCMTMRGARAAGALTQTSAPVSYTHLQRCFALC